MARNKKLHLLKFAIPVIFLVPAYFIFYNSFSGDASIYFTFFKNFFQLPFSFYPDEVSFGATSPLHVVLHAPIHAMFGHSWFRVSQLLSFMFIPTGLLFLNQAIKGNWVTLMLMSAFTVTAKQMLIATCQLYESSLAFLAISILYNLLKRSLWRHSIFIAGMLYLIRPELLLVTLVVYVYVLYASKQTSSVLFTMMLSLCPVVIYHSYMFSHTGQILPSSVIARGLRSLENSTMWFERVKVSFSYLLNADGYIYSLGAVSLLAFGLCSLRKYVVEFLLFLPLPLLFFLIPPQGYILRYLLPILPIAVVSSTILVNSCRPINDMVKHLFHRQLHITYQWILAVSVVLGTLAVYGVYLRTPRVPLRYEFDTVLLNCSFRLES